MGGGAGAMRKLGRAAAEAAVVDGLPPTGDVTPARSPRPAIRCGAKVSSGTSVSVEATTVESDDTSVATLSS
jgi:hypothetical protein